MTRARRRPTKAEKELADVRQEVLEAVATLARQVKALASAARRREVRLQKVEAKEIAQDRLLIGLNASIHSFQRHLEGVVKEEAQTTRTVVNDYIRTALSEASLGARVSDLEDARYTDAVRGNGKGGPPPP